MSRAQIAIVGGTLLVVLFFTLGWFCVIPYVFVKCDKDREAPPEVELELWGVFDDSDVFRDLIHEYKTQVRKNVRNITYRKVSIDDYERALLNELAAGKGPDIWYLHSSWLPKHFDKISPMPDTLLNLVQFRDTFVDVAYQDYIRDEKIYALPLYTDTLALYYNEDLLESAGFSAPPRTWEEMNVYVPALTKKSDLGIITRAGATLGTAYNINRSVDILWLLMLQLRTKMADERRGVATFADPVSIAGSETAYPGENALAYYTDFANSNKKNYTWNKGFDYSIDAFSQGRAAMMINYAYHLPTIRRHNPNLRFAIAPVPQIAQDAPVNYANYWGLTVKAYPEGTKDAQAKRTEAWRFVKWLTEKSQSEKYLILTNRPAARRDILPSQYDHLTLSVFARQALSAKSWFQISDTEALTIFASAIEKVNTGAQTVREALREAQSNVGLLMQDARLKNRLPRL